MYEYTNNEQMNNVCLRCLLFRSCPSFSTFLRFSVWFDNHKLTKTQSEQWDGQWTSKIVVRKESETQNAGTIVNWKSGNGEWCNRKSIQYCFYEWQSQFYVFFVDDEEALIQ